MFRVESNNKFNQNPVINLKIICRDRQMGIASLSCANFMLFREITKIILEDVSSVA